MKHSAFFLLLVGAAAASTLAQEPAAQPSPTAQTAATPKPTPITIQSAEAGDVKVFFLNAPWGPQTFAMMERGGDSFYNKRTWPFARLETRQALAVADAVRAAGEGGSAFVRSPGGAPSV